MDPYIIDGLSVSFDYFNVEIEDYITTTPVNAAQIMINCFDASLGRGGPGSAACNAVGRDNEGRLNRIFLGYQNLGLHEVSGFDINIDYGFDFLSGFMDINYFATKIDERSIKDNTYGDVNFDCVGIFNGDCDNLISYPVFDFKHRMTAGWSKGDLISSSSGGTQDHWTMETLQLIISRKNWVHILYSICQRDIKLMTL